MIFREMTTKDLEKFQKAVMDTAIIIQAYRPKGMSGIEWTAKCEEYKVLVKMGALCFCELVRRNAEGIN